tara:strand:- start:372 stop:728 length:357 start_codon:yes stop_codon:yes gene_type:complete
MAGIGEYKKGGKFTLKSGNSPLFKHMGGSPLKGRFIDALKKGEFREAGKVLKKEGQAIGAALFQKEGRDLGGGKKAQWKGFFRHKDERGERAAPTYAYYEEKRRQRREGKAEREKNKK